MTIIDTSHKEDNNVRISKDEIIHIIEDDVLYLGDLREASDLSKVRLSYNTVVICRKGCLLVEIGGDQQVKVMPGQILLIPTGKLVQPMMMSTDIEAMALLVSDKMLRTVLGNQINVWNEAMYMKELFVVGNSSRLESFENSTHVLFSTVEKVPFHRDILTSFLRMMFLMLCGELINQEGVGSIECSSNRDKEIFNQFLMLLSEQDQKRQRVAYYADRLNITPKYLSTVCKKVSAKSPMRWITESVMADCYMLLKETDYSVKEISNRLGFPNSSFFGQYFREQAGSTPLEYRLGHRRIV